MDKGLVSFRRDREGQMTTRFVLCGACKRLRLDGKQRCKAFLEGIPKKILDGKFDHTKKFPGQDNDLLFEPIRV